VTTRQHVRDANVRFGSKADTTAGSESSKSGNGDLQHLGEMTLRSA
jgi:hypothetical protein